MEVIISVETATLAGRTVSCRSSRLWTIDLRLASGHKSSNNVKAQNVHATPTQSTAYHHHIPVLSRLVLNCMFWVTRNIYDHYLRVRVCNG
nr:hypothetical protein Itr_chr07CG06400 [Ipomoea trifida]